MPLFDIDGRMQNGEGSTPHWTLYRRHRRTPLHDAVLSRITPAVDRGEFISASQLGSRVLQDLRTEDPRLVEGVDHAELSGLFGMFLWNCIAQHEASWRFDSPPGDEGEPAGKRYWRG